MVFRLSDFLPPLPLVEFRVPRKLSLNSMHSKSVSLSDGPGVRVKVGLAGSAGILLRALVPPGPLMGRAVS